MTGIDDTTPMAGPDGAPACGCSGHSRATFLKRAVAHAGNGLPAIEPGMPLPAGTGLSRRSFLSRTAGLALSVYGANVLSDGALTEGIDAAMAAAPANPILVNVFLDGGCDSLSLLAPTGSAHLAKFQQLRPTLGQAPGTGAAFGGDNSLEWHPQAAALAQLWDAGKLNVAPAIGYSSPNQSHFTSRHYYEVGELNAYGRYGWLGRYLDLHGDAANPLQGLALDYALSPMLAASRVPVAAVASPSGYNFNAAGVQAPIQQAMLDSFRDMGAAPAGADALGVARTATRSTTKLREQVAAFSTITSPVVYRHANPAGSPPTNNTFAQRMRSLGAMLGAGLPLRCVALNGSGGYDTHSGEAATLPTNFRASFETLQDFQADVEARGLADRVLVSVWSEFGRRPQENGSGTDHGAAGMHLLMGTQAAGVMVDAFPGLSTLDNRGNLRVTSDFRGLYCSLLEQWLGVDPSPIIPGASGFARYKLLKS